MYQLDSRKHNLYRILLYIMIPVSLYNTFFSVHMNIFLFYIVYGMAWKNEEFLFIRFQVSIAVIQFQFSSDVNTAYIHQSYNYHISS